MAQDDNSIETDARSLLSGHDPRGKGPALETVFAAWGLATCDPEAAWSALDAVMETQWPNGMVPSARCDADDEGSADAGPVPSSGFSFPPVFATVLRSLWEADPGSDRAASFLEPLERWHRWFMDHRTDKGAVCIVHPDESGRPMSPHWSPALDSIGPDAEQVRAEITRRSQARGWNEDAIAENRIFLVADPLMTFTLLRANRDLAYMAGRFDHDTADMETWTQRLEAGSVTLWAEEAGGYAPLDTLAERSSDTISLGAMLCWYAGLDDGRMLPHLDRVTSLVSVPLPGYDPARPGYDPAGEDTGAMSPVWNALVADGLTSTRHALNADRLKRETRTCIEESGLAGAFNVETRAALGDPAVATAATWMVWIAAED